MSVERCWLVWPHAGQLVTFSGKMLHGVLPLPAAGPIPTAVESECRPLRQTVLLNLWAHRPLQLPKLPSVLVPQLAGQETSATGSTLLAGASLVPGQSANVSRPPLVSGSVRSVHWSESSTSAWQESTALTLGMFDRTERLWVRLPAATYRGNQIEEFATEVCTSRECRESCDDRGSSMRVIS